MSADFTYVRGGGRIGHHTGALRGIVDGCAAHGDGRQVENPEPQRSLFCWAEFLAAERVKPKGRSGKPQPSSLSLFEWAFSLEQERDVEPVGAER